VQVLDEEDERKHAAHPEPELPERVEGPRHQHVAVQLAQPVLVGLLLEPEQVQEVGRPVPTLPAERVEGGAHLVGGTLRRVDVGDAAGAAHEVEDGQVRHGGAVRQTAPLEEPRAGADGAPQLQEKARLAEARLTDHARHSPPSLLHLDEQLAEGRDLAVAAHEAAPGPPIGRAEHRRRRFRADEVKCRDRAGEPAELERAGGLERDLVLDESGGRLAEQDCAGRGRLLKPGREMRRVSDRRVVHAQVVADRPDHDESGIEPHPHAERHGLARLERQRPVGHGAGNSEGGERGAPGMVLVGDGRAEERHEAVAQELVHRAFVAVHLRQGELEEAAQEVVHQVGAEALGEGGGAHEIAEEHGHRLALALQHRVRGEDLVGEVARRVDFRRPRALGGRGRRLDGAPTFWTEARARGQLGRAARADGAETGTAARTEPRPRRVVVVARGAAHTTMLLYLALRRTRGGIGLSWIFADAGRW
jgi:hypothetical protein